MKIYVDIDINLGINNKIWDFILSPILIIDTRIYIAIFG